MAISKARKDELVAQYSKLIEDSDGIFIAEYTGMNVKSMEVLREDIDKADLILAWEGSVRDEYDNVFYFSRGDFDAFLKEVVFFNEFFVVLVSHALSEDGAITMDLKSFIDPNT